MIGSYFNATADKIKKKTGTDGYGDPEFEIIAENVGCRKIEKIKLVRNDKGDEVVSSIEVWLPPEFNRLPPQSEIVFHGEAQTVIKSGHVSGMSEDLYLQVFLQ